MKEKPNSFPKERITETQTIFYKDWVSKMLGTQPSAGAKQAEYNDIFSNKHIVAISGLRLPPAPSFLGYPGINTVKEKLKRNILSLRGTGVDGVVLESYLDRPHRIFYDDVQLLEYYHQIATFAKRLSQGEFKVGINLILFDIFGALSIAKTAGLDFVAVDEYVNNVSCSKEESNYPNSFIFEPHPELVNNFRDQIGAMDIAIFGGSHSNYYPLVGSVDLNDSIVVASNNGAAAVILGKDNRDIFKYENGPLPVLASGGIKFEDLDWIAKMRFAGFMAGSLFESSFGVIDRDKTTNVMKGMA